LACELTQQHPREMAYAHGPGSLLRVRAVNVGDISLHCLPNGLFATTRRGSGSSPVGIHYGSARSASSCRNGLFWICRECAETCT